MSLIYELGKIIEDSKREYEAILAELKRISLSENQELHTFEVTESFGPLKDEKNNILAKGDNLSFMKWLISKEYYKGNIKLIYVDPPFFSKADYNMQVKINTKISNKTTSIKKIVYSDTWNDGIESYLRMICIRLLVMRDLLSDDGCIWMHLDWHVTHYVKILMDEIFGIDNFVNEVIWNYKSGGSGNRSFARKHDTLLFYGKTRKYFFEVQKEKSYNRGFKPYRFKGVEEFQDELGWHTLVNMKDVWQMDMVGRTSAERTGYATQKPEALLERILKSCTREGDLCADFFGGSGTLAVAAHKMNRRWITSDIGGSAVAGIKKRLLKSGAKFIFIRDVSEPEIEFNADFKVSLEKTSEGRLRLTLHNYSIDKGFFRDFGESDREILQTIIKEDSLSLIDYWSADFDYDGKIHKSKCVRLREKGILEESMEKISMRNISVFCVDVFGNVSKKILKGDIENGELL